MRITPHDNGYRQGKTLFHHLLVAHADPHIKNWLILWVAANSRAILWFVPVLPLASVITSSNTITCRSDRVTPQGVSPTSTLPKTPYLKPRA